MKKVSTLFFVLAVGLAIFYSCEKDDICPPETLSTPYLKVGFYNFSNQDVNKAVPNLRIIGIDSTGFRDTLNTFIDRTSQTSIEIPLKTSEDSSQFLFIFNSKDDEETGKELGNIDTLKFNYTRQEHFISRGCGYGTIFTELVTILNPAYTNNSIQNPGEWIRSIFDQDNNLEHQDTIHVKIYH